MQRTPDCLNKVSATSTAMSCDKMQSVRYGKCRLCGSVAPHGNNTTSYCRSRAFPKVVVIRSNDSFMGNSEFFRVI